MLERVTAGVDEIQSAEIDERGRRLLRRGLIVSRDDGGGASLGDRCIPHEIRTPRSPGQFFGGRSLYSISSSSVISQNSSLGAFLPFLFGAFFACALFLDLVGAGLSEESAESDD